LSATTPDGALRGDHKWERLNQPFLNNSVQPLPANTSADHDPFVLAIIVGFVVGTCGFAAGTAWLVRHQ
jgi:hypothetical protein